MLKYIFRRILISIPVLLGISIINFGIICMAPGNIIDILSSPHATQAALDAKKAALGLDVPIYLQYFRWINNALHGDFGYSMATYAPVSQMIGERIKPTIILMGTSLVIGFLIAIIMGVLSAIKQHSKLDYFVVTGSFTVISIPSFFLSLGLIYFFSLFLKILPSSGMFNLGQEGGIFDLLKHLILPSIVLSLKVAGRNIRFIRSSMVEILKQNYLTVARAKGLKEFWVIGKHGLKNALITILTLLGFEISMIFAGSIITEKVFSWPGIGQLIMDSIISRDYPTIMSLNLLIAVSVVIVNLVVDIIYVVIDPRVKYN